MIRAIAPDAQILFYEVPESSSSYSDVINRIVADRRASIISSSWGQCELGVDAGERAGDSRALSVAVASGVSMFVASGDSGAYDCQQADLNDYRLSVDWPAASANAVAVGGTRLYLGADGSYERETAWEDQLSNAAGGGGFSLGDARPSWQTGPGVQSSHFTGHRQLPDVAAAADPATGWSLYSRGQLGEAGGTSAAAPFWAASMLLIQQYAAAHLDQLLYALAASRQPYPPCTGSPGAPTATTRRRPAGTPRPDSAHPTCTTWLGTWWPTSVRTHARHTHAAPAPDTPAWRTLKPFCSAGASFPSAAWL